MKFTMVQKGRYNLLVLTGIAVAFLVGCSTQKAKWTNVTYHNTTCHYNVWWNGNESLKDGKKKLKTAAADDYTQILPVYNLGTKEQAMAVYPQMDKAVEKGVKGIKKHSIYVHGQEHVKYVKNCYLLTAYATFYKQDLAATENTCRLIINQFGGTYESDEARILLARCATQRKQYTEAEGLLDQLVNEQGKNNFSPKLADELYLAMVEALLPQEKYKKTVQYIRLALDETSSRQTKARLYFIMAQIYQKLDKRPTATKYYQKVLSCHPDYVMEFNARINIASCSDMNSTNISEVEKSLDKMLKDKKNEEFADQIYYAKGEMYLGVRDIKKACDNYKLSVAAATNNPAQKAKSALRMADVLYEQYENYDLAQSYYDTAMHIIKAGYPHFDEIRSRYNTLTALVENTRVVERNDSLLAMADMNPSEREAKIRKQIDELKRQEKEAEENRLIEELKKDAQAQQNTLQGDWYFYNHNTVNKGKQTFRQRWGNRLLDDYWFLSKRNSFAMGGMIPGLEGSDLDDEASEESDSTDSKTAVKKPNDDPNDPHCMAYYLKDLPTTQGQRDTMHMEIAKCLLNAGYIYYDGIENTERALECYLRLARDYPDNDEIVQAFYQLWRIYNKQGNTPGANYYKDMILMGFPDCDYANMIRDDEYYLEIIKRSEVAQSEYATVYNLFRKKKYSDVIKHVDVAHERYSEEPLMGKFTYWKGMALSQMHDSAEAVKVFKGIVEHYPDTMQLVALAKEQLNYIKTGNFSSENITSEDEERAKHRYAENTNDVVDKRNNNNSKNTNSEENPLPPESMMFRYRENMQHYVLVLINDKKIVATQLQYAIGDFNTTNYSNSGYRASPLLFTDTIQMLTIHRFTNAEAAENYKTHLLLEGGPLSRYNPKDYMVFTISTQNYNTFYSQKNIEAYRLFYERYYMKKD
ncbi:MAG: tetratricopeptide repeat protein [Bacteroidales bacterium]|nr:tetratricopeptide repeat protein [Bacteroidales bacterium]